MQRMTVIDRSVVQRMETMVNCHKADVIQHHFGISLNTWAKLRKGMAIRNSVAERLVSRLTQVAH